MSNHISQFTCLAYIVMCVHPLSQLCFCTLLCSTVQCTVVQYLYCKPRMSGRKCKSSGEVAGTTVLFKVLYCKIKNVFFIFCVCLFMCYLCEKCYEPIAVLYSRLCQLGTQANFVGLTNKLDLGTSSWNRTLSYVGDLMYFKFYR